MGTDQLWKTVLDDLEVSVSRSNFVTWIQQTRLVHLQQVDAGRQIAEIACRSAYHREFIERRYREQIRDALDRVTKLSNELVFVVQDLPLADQSGNSDPGPLFHPIALSGDDLYREAYLRARLRADFVFETFAVSSSNEMAYAAAQAVAKSPGTAYNPLFIYGGVGVGKTHLIQAIGHTILLNNPETPLIYCTGEQFTNEIINAIRRKETFSFKKKFRSAQTLLIDDIQFIAGKTSVQEEFFHTFNAIVQDGGQVILVSDQPPQAIEGLEDRLRSRFEGGLIIDIQQPNFELRTAILLIKAKTFGVSLPMDIAQLVAANIESSRKLEGFLARLTTEARLRRQEVSEPLVRGLLGNLNDQDNKPPPSVRPKVVVSTVAFHFGFPVSSLLGGRRSKPLVLARHLAMYILRIDHRLPLEEVGSLFGGRDHTTVMHAVEKVSGELSDSEQMRVELAALRKKLYS